MRSIYSKEDFETPEVGTFTKHGEPLEGIPQYDDFCPLASEQEQMDSYVEDTTTSINALTSKLGVLNDMSDNIYSKAENSDELVVTLENYKPVLDGLAIEFGERPFTPSLEDIHNPYLHRSTKELALEGIKGFIKKVWDQLKKIVVEFFKRVREFFKRISGGIGMEQKTYEKYVPDLINKIKKDNLLCDISKKDISTRLVPLFGTSDMTEVEVTYLLEDSDRRINNLITQNKTGFVSKMEGIKEDVRTIREVSSLIEESDSIESDLTNIQTTTSLIRSIYTNLSNKAIDYRNIPEIAADKLTNIINYVPGTHEIRSLAGNDVEYDSLPGNFNIYSVRSDDSAEGEDIVLGAFSSKDTGYTGSNVVGPISQVSHLESYYKLYKELKASDNSKKILSISADVEKDVLRTIDSLSVIIGTKIEVYKKLPVNESELDELSRLKLALFDMTTNLTKKISSSATSETLTGIVEEGKESKGLAVLNTMKRLVSGEFIENIDLEIGYITNSLVTNLGVNLSDLTDTMVSIYKDLDVDMLPYLSTVSGMSDQDLINLSTSAKNFDLMTKRFMNNFTSVMKGFTTDLGVLNLHLQREMIEYIYLSARRYGKAA